MQIDQKYRSPSSVFRIRSRIESVRRYIFDYFKRGNLGSVCGGGIWKHTYKFISGCKPFSLFKTKNQTALLYIVLVFLRSLRVCSCCATLFRTVFDVSLCFTALHAVLPPKWVKVWNDQKNAIKHYRSLNTCWHHHMLSYWTCKMNMW